MASGSLIVDVENLTGVTITSMQTLKGEVDTAHENMKNAVQKMVDNGYMDSETAIAYVDEFKELISSDLLTLSTLIESYYTQLGQICESFLEGDASMASGIMGATMP